MSKECLNALEMSKAEEKITEFFNNADAVQAEDGAWYYSESSVNSELLSIYAELAKANERVAELELSMGKLRTEILHACVEGSSSSGGIKKSSAHHLHHQALMIPPYTEQLRKEQE